MNDKNQGLSNLVRAGQLSAIGNLLAEQNRLIRQQAREQARGRPQSPAAAPPSPAPSNPPPQVVVRYFPVPVQTSRVEFVNLGWLLAAAFCAGVAFAVACMWMWWDYDYQQAFGYVMLFTVMGFPLYVVLQFVVAENALAREKEQQMRDAADPPVWVTDRSHIIRSPTRRESGAAIASDLCYVQGRSKRWHAEARSRYGREDAGPGR